ncbi:hypothetical protein L3V32_09905 [Vibrio sp. J2-4]|uniref:hypothetical protein n=1 Tax=Vibrio sp. J2-4 TaxID=1507977 RepID=UPI001F28C0D9|nr:hypothetical protein [Vibrio sp. J2-4]MCF7477007.1 hypothetical protein [Vibrio sp. J2-4]
MSDGKFILSTGGEEILLSITPDYYALIVTGAIGLGSILTSIAVVWITRRNQKSQSQEKIAELRQAWVTELRENMSQFISIAYLVAVNGRQTSNYQLTDDANRNYKLLFYYRSKILLMLDAEKEYTKVLKSLMKDVTSSVGKEDANSLKNLGSYARALEEQCQSVLEKAWNDIKTDLAK